jgi:hypothetical protein
LLSYSAPGGPREVLFATVTEATEAKLIEALGVSDQKMIPAQVQQGVTGRLPLDEQQQLHEQVSKAAKSVNHKLKQGIEIPQQTIGYYQTAKSAIQAVLDDPASSSDEKAMGAYYAAQLNTIADRIRGAPPYDEGGKIPVTQPYLHTGMATVTKYVPAPVDDPESGQFPAALRTASRIKASIDSHDPSQPPDRLRDQLHRGRHGGRPEHARRPLPRQLTSISPGYPCGSEMRVTHQRQLCSVL